MTDAHAALRTELGGRLPAGVQALPEADIARLAAIVRTAKAEQSRALDAAMDRGLRALPLLLRKPVKKILFG